MKNRRFILSAAVAVILLAASIASAAPGAILVYNETDLGSGNWQYDYIFYNTSTDGEALHEVYLYFTGDVNVTGTSLPAGWDGLPWTGPYFIDYLNTYSADFMYDVVAGYSLDEFSFTVDYQAGDILFDAYFSGDKLISGTIADCQNVLFYGDTDGDGYGNPADTVTACSVPAGYIADNTDCDDTNSAINPDTLWYLDLDEDGYGNPDDSVQSCVKPAGYVADNADCNDIDSAINPDTMWFPDEDGDGYGDLDWTVFVQQCEQPAGPPDYVLNGIDFNDSNSLIGPPNRIDGGPTSYYLSLQEAYNAAADGVTIQSVYVTFTEDLTLNANKSVTLEGGYNGSYSTITGNTALQGVLIISKGALTIGNFELF